MKSLVPLLAKQIDAAFSTVSKKSAQSLLEIIIALTLFSILTLSALYLLLPSVKVQPEILNEDISQRLLNECLEAVRGLRNNNFTNLANGTYALSEQNSVYQLINNPPEIIANKYQRQLLIEDVLRDANFNIGETGTVDAESKKVTCQVEYDRPKLGRKRLTQSIYLTNWQNLNLTDTLLNEFQQGNFSDTESISSDPPPPDNGSVTLKVVTSPSGFTSSADVDKNANDLVVDGNYAFVVVDDDRKALHVVDISDVNRPRDIKSIDVSGKGNAIAKKDNYLFIGTNNNTKGLVVVDISDPRNPNRVKEVNVAEKISDIFIKDNFAYLGSDNWLNGLIIVDISNPLNPIKKSASLSFGRGTAVAVQGTYAFLASDFSLTGLNVIDVADPVNPRLRVLYYINGKASGIAIRDQTAYMGIDNARNGFAAINIADPLNPRLIRTINLGTQGRNISIFDKYAYVSTNLNNAGIAIVDIEDSQNPLFLFTQDIQGTARGTIPSLQYIYATSSNNDRGFVIIGTPKENFETAGTFTSRIFETSSTQTTYFTIKNDFLNSPGGTIGLKFRTGNTIGELRNALFVGSDGTNNTSYQNGLSKITLNPANPGRRYFQYQISFQGDGASSPVVNQVTVNYRP